MMEGRQVVTYQLLQSCTVVDDKLDIPGGQGGEWWTEDDVGQS